MSAPGRPERELLPLGGKARSAKGARTSATGRPERELLPLGGKARSAKGAPTSVEPAAANGAATVLAFDFGTRRIGVAVGNTLIRVARPLTTIAGEANAARFAAVEALIGEWRPDLLVIGRPVHADGVPHAMTARAERFARQLEGRFGLRVARVDERFTTVGADSVLAAAGVRARERKAARDEVAAQLILQSWFDEPVGNDTCGAA